MDGASGFRSRNDRNVTRTFLCLSESSQSGAHAAQCSLLGVVLRPQLRKPLKRDRARFVAASQIKRVPETSHFVTQSMVLAVPAKLTKCDSVIGLV